MITQTQSRMSTRDRKLAKELKEKLSSIAGNRLIEIIVYGSRARGEGLADSDLDVAVIVDRRTPELEKALEDATYQIMWEHDFSPIISLKIFGEGHFKDALQKGFSFYRHLAEEGVSV